VAAHAIGVRFGVDVAERFNGIEEDGLGKLPAGTGEEFAGKDGVAGEAEGLGELGILAALAGVDEDHVERDDRWLGSGHDLERFSEFAAEVADALGEFVGVLIEGEDGGLRSPGRGAVYTEEPVGGVVIYLGGEGRPTGEKGKDSGSGDGEPVATACAHG